MKTIGTAQNRAYLWLLNNSNLSTFTDSTKIQRYALATLFYTTNGKTTWQANIRNGGWLTNAPECNWATTASNPCSGTTYTSLTLDFVGVSGQLSPEIGLLSSLSRLNIQGNSGGAPGLSGTLPESLGNLTNMESFRFTNNYITGTILSRDSLL